MTDLHIIMQKQNSHLRSKEYPGGVWGEGLGEQQSLTLDIPFAEVSQGRANRKDEGKLNTGCWP